MSKSELSLQIDPHRLDEEWVEQPEKYFRAATQLADARRDLDEAKSELEVTRAELDLAIRRDPAGFDLSKVTESSVTAVITNEHNYREKQGVVIKAKHNVDIMAALVSALDHRKSALQKLVELFLANYFSRPRASEGSGERMREVEKSSVRGKGRRRSTDG